MNLNPLTMKTKMKWKKIDGAYYFDDKYVVTKVGNKYLLSIDGGGYVKNITRLSTAKQVAELIERG